MPPHTSFFLPYQKRWIQDPSRLKILQKSRQIGMSWAAAYRATREVIGTQSRLDVWISSRDETQARLFLEDCRKFAKILSTATAGLSRSVVLADRHSHRSLHFRSGRAIHSLSSNPDAQAGKRGTRVLDEFALHPDSRRLYSIAYPGITWGGSLEIISTHRGNQSFFNQLIAEITQGGNPKGFSLHTITLPDALKDGFLQKLKSRLPPEDPRQFMSDDDYLQFVRSGCPDEETWQQEYLCQPADDNTAIITYEDLCACEYQEGDYEELEFAQQQDIPQRKCQYFLGVDLGRTNDLTVFWLLERQADLLLTRKISVLRNMPFCEQEKVLGDFLALPGLHLCSIDATGFGMAFAEQAVKTFGQARIESVCLNNALKQKLAYDLRQAFEQRRIRIPSDRTIRADLRAVRREQGSGDTLKITAERTKEGHSDRFWALALAIRAAGVAKAPLRFEPISRVSGRR